MNVATSGRTWDDASSPASLRLTRRYEEAWQEAERGGRRLDPAEFLAELGEPGDAAGVRLAILRADLSLRWDSGDRAGAQWYLERFPDMGEDSLVALIYEEFCLREEEGEGADPVEFLERYEALAEPLRRVLDIHRLIGSATASNSSLFPSSSVSVSPLSAGAAIRARFPEVGQTIAGFSLVEELGRGAFGRVFLARERQLADRSVALKVTRKGSREPQALARLQHTHIVPVHSHRIDPATGLHLLCMPYFGRITLARVLMEVRRSEQAGEGLSGESLVAALDRLGDPASSPEKPGLAPERASGRSACRASLATRTYAQAIAWWGSRLAEALAHAHERGVLHRDIKPSNVLLMDDGMPMLLDFNLARELISTKDRADESEEVTLGGTVDYMAPEHLEALADGQTDEVDGRSDIYGVGVLLFEAVAGRKPFLPPRKSQSVIDALLRAADDRRRGLARILPAGTPVPAPLEAIIRRCLEPEPASRYQSAGDLASDLRAVADDLPLVHAREPVVSRVRRRLRRNRQRLTIAGVVLLAAAAILGAYANFQFERDERYQEVFALYRQGCAAIEQGEFKQAEIWLDGAAKRARRSELEVIRNQLKWETFWGLGAKLRSKLELLWTRPGMEELEGQIQLKASVAKLVGTARGQADDLLRRSESLRFRLIGWGDDVPSAVKELRDLLAPFYVLTSKKEWNKLDHIWELLEKDQRLRLQHEVNELLFLWMVGIEASYRAVERSPKPVELARDPALLNQATGVCDRALTFAERKGPWCALRVLLAQHRASPIAAAKTDSQGNTRDGQDPVALLEDEPAHVAMEESASACFQWGLLASSLERRERAIEWLQQAVWLDWSNYWYHFYLAYLEDQAGLRDDALDHYCAAVAREPDSPWVRFSRARLYRAKGRWSWALDDLRRARDLMGESPESVQVALELGVLHQSLGSFAAAATEYRTIISTAPHSPYARAARLNLANIDAESGREAEARLAYEALLKDDPNDSSARLSRALLELRLGRPGTARGDLDVLLEPRQKLRKRDEALATRAVANILERRTAEALADAREAVRVRPSPAHERLLQRALLAAGHFDEVQLDRPEEIRLLPVQGAWLTADLRAAAAALGTLPRRQDAATYRALLSRAVILSGLGQHRDALQALDCDLALTTFSPQAHLVRARILEHSGALDRALREVEEGLKLESDEPRLLELQGALRTSLGHPDLGLASLDRAINRAPHHFAHMHKASALVALGQNESAVLEWTLALNRDPELPDAYLGRARTYARLRLWDRALADLEQAAAWAHTDLALQSAILVAYAKCLPERPDHQDRWQGLLVRGLHQGWDLLKRAPAGAIPAR
jgi:serine/threonine protein kinase/predicted Zn-dependent protease